MKTSTAISSIVTALLFVTGGVYEPDQGAGQVPGDREATFQLPDGVTLEGGYAGCDEPDPEERDIALLETILSGDLVGNDGKSVVKRANPNTKDPRKNNLFIWHGCHSERSEESRGNCRGDPSLRSG